MADILQALQIAGIGMGAVVSIMTAISFGIWVSGRIAVGVENRVENRKQDRRQVHKHPVPTRRAHRAAA